MCVYGAGENSVLAGPILAFVSMCWQIFGPTHPTKIHERRKGRTKRYRRAAEEQLVIGPNNQQQTASTATERKCEYSKDPPSTSSSPSTSTINTNDLSAINSSNSNSNSAMTKNDSGNIDLTVSVNIATKKPLSFRHLSPTDIEQRRVIGPTNQRDLTRPCCNTPRKEGRQTVEMMRRSSQSSSHSLLDDEDGSCDDCRVDSQNNGGNTNQSKSDDDFLPGLLDSGVKYQPRKLVAEGWLHKKGTGNDWLGSRAWKPRWARLVVSHLSSCPFSGPSAATDDDDNDAVPLGAAVVSLDVFFVVSGAPCGNQTHSFAFSLSLSLTLTLYFPYDYLLFESDPTKPRPNHIRVCSLPSWRKGLSKHRCCSYIGTPRRISPQRSSRWKTLWSCHPRGT